MKYQVSMFFLITILFSNFAIASEDPNSLISCNKVLEEFAGLREVKAAGSVTEVLKNHDRGEKLTLTIHLYNRHLQMDTAARRVRVVGEKFTAEAFKIISEKMRQACSFAEVAPVYLKNSGVGLITVTAKISDYRLILDVLHDPTLPLSENIELWPPQTFRPGLSAASPLD